MRMSSVLSCIRHRQAARTCADTLKSLSTAAELAAVQFNFMKAFTTAGIRPDNLLYKNIKVDRVIMIIQ